MSDRESQQASIDASEASLPAENGSREVENDPPPLGRAEESVSDAGVAARTRFQRRLQNVAGTQNGKERATQPKSAPLPDFLLSNT